MQIEVTDSLVDDYVYELCDAYQTFRGNVHRGYRMSAKTQERFRKIARKILESGYRINPRQYIRYCFDKWSPAPPINALGGENMLQSYIAWVSAPESIAAERNMLRSNVARVEARLNTGDRIEDILCDTTHSTPPLLKFYFAHVFKLTNLIDRFRPSAQLQWLSCPWAEDIYGGMLEGDARDSLCH